MNRLPTPLLTVVHSASYNCKGEGYAISRPPELATLHRVAVRTGILLGT